VTGHQVALLVSAQAFALVSPGPAVVAIMQKSFAEGRARALPYGLGLGFGASLWCAFALAGLSVVFHLVPVLFLALKILGGAYLVYLAVKIWRGADLPLGTPAEGSGLRDGFLGGVLLNLSNPKPALFFSAVILTVFPEALTLPQQATVYGIVLAMEWGFYLAVTVLLTRNAVRATYFAAKRWIDRSTSVVLGALGLSLAISR
jgi:threonine/homoserine/homoserine lactone efflux protein